MRKINVFWIVSAVLLVLASLWTVIPGLNSSLSQDIVCGIVLILFGVISVLASFSIGIKASGSGWILFEGFCSVLIGLAFVVPGFSDKLFTVSLSIVLGLWLLVLGLSQIARSSRIGGGAGHIAYIVSGVFATLGGLSVFVAPISNMFFISKTIKLCDYNVTYLLFIAGILVAARCFAKGRKG